MDGIKWDEGDYNKYLHYLNLTVHFIFDNFFSFSLDDLFISTSDDDTDDEKSHQQKVQLRKGLI